MDAAEDLFSLRERRHSPPRSSPFSAPFRPFSSDSKPSFSAREQLPTVAVDHTRQFDLGAGLLEGRGEGISGADLGGAGHPRSRGRARAQLVAHRLVQRLCDQAQQDRLRAYLAGWSLLTAQWNGPMQGAAITRTPFQAWLAWMCDRRREMGRSDRLADMLERRDRAALLHQCLLKWQNAKSESRAYQIYVMRERLEKADAECCVLRRNQEESAVELQRCREQAQDGKGKAHWAEGELLRRSEQEFSRLRELEAELAQMQAEERATSATVSHPGPSSGSEAPRARQRTGAAVAVATLCQAAFAGQSLLKLCWSFWVADVSARSVMGELLDQCAAAEVACFCKRVFMVWRCVVDMMRTRGSTRCSMNELANFHVTCNSRLCSCALHLWREIVCAVRGRRDALPDAGAGLDRELYMRRQLDEPGGGQDVLPLTAYLLQPSVIEARPLAGVVAEVPAPGRLTPPLPPRYSGLGSHESQLVQGPPGGKVVLHCGPARFPPSGESRG